MFVWSALILVSLVPLQKQIALHVLKTTLQPFIYTEIHAKIHVQTFIMLIQVIFNALPVLLHV